MLTLIKSCGLSAVLVCGACLCVSDAQACGGGWCKVQRSCCAPCCAAPAMAPASATDVPPPPVEPKATMEGRQRYQSAYQAAPNMMPSPRLVRPMQSWSDQFRGDHKFFGR